MNFTIHQLSIFLEVSKHQNITRAAESMFMTQPALSIQLKNFQNQFEINLFEKAGRKLLLTDFGMSIAVIAENILKESEALKYKTKEYEGLLTGKLNIASASTGKYVIPFYLSGFINSHPGIDLKLNVSNKTEVIKNLQNKTVDFALVSVVPDGIDTEEEILLDNKLFLVNSSTTLDRRKPILYREQGSATRKATDSYFKDTAKRKSMELTSNEAVKQSVIANLGYSIIPLIGIKNQLENEELHIIPSKGLPIITHWRLIWLKGRRLSPVAEAYLTFVREEKKNIFERSFKWIESYE